MKTFLVLVLALSAFAYSSFSKPLDGSAWDVKVRENKLFALGRKDTLIFDHGKFSSMERHSGGFAPARYDAQATKSGSVATWQAESVDPEGRELDWRGQVEGDHIEGTMTSVSKDGISRAYAFKGKRRA